MHMHKVSVSLLCILYDFLLLVKMFFDPMDPIVTFATTIVFCLSSGLSTVYCDQVWSGSNVGVICEKDVFPQEQAEA